MSKDSEKSPDIVEAVPYRRQLRERPLPPIKHFQVVYTDEQTLRANKSKKSSGERGTATKSNAPKVEETSDEEQSISRPIWKIRPFASITKQKKSKRRDPVKIEYEDDEEAESSTKKTKMSTPAASSTTGATPPNNWETVLENIKIMRSDKKAPVDTMGCERTMEENVDEKIRRYQTLISLMLSSQTKDEITFAAMKRLKSHGLQPLNIQNTNQSKLESMIKPVGFYKKKAEFIKRTTDILIEKYDSDIPSTIQGLLKLPGVGPKMGYICLNVAWGANEGIGVDTHVHRISQRLQWTNEFNLKKFTPEDARKELESWLPRNLWQEINILLVGFGQTICLPINPKCGECLNKDLCPFGIEAVKKIKKRSLDFEYFKE